MVIKYYIALGIRSDIRKVFDNNISLLLNELLKIAKISKLVIKTIVCRNELFARIIAVAVCLKLML